LTSFPFARWLAGAAAALGCAAPLLAQTHTCTPDGNNSDDNYILGEVDSALSAMHWPTGLVWKRCQEGQSFNYFFGSCGGETKATWNHWAETEQRLPKSFQGQDTWGISAGFSQNLLDSGGWRMPYMNELRQITEDCANNLNINRTVFPSMVPWVSPPFPQPTLWSGSPDASNVSRAEYFNFYTGSVSAYPRGTNLSIHLVRGGQPFIALTSPAAQNAATPGAAVTFGVFTLSPSMTPGQAWGGARISGDGDPQFQVNGGAWVQQAIVKSGDTITVQLTAPITGSRTATFTLRSGQTTGTSDDGSNLGAETTAVQTTTASFTANAAPIPGVCGNSLASVTAPSANLCATGTATSVNGSGGQWQWGCNGSDGGASTAANACTAPYASQTLSISASPTSITVGSTSAITAGSTAAGLAVALTPSGACTLNGGTATGTAEGTCTVTASQPGTGDNGAARYLPAVSVPTHITVTPAPVHAACASVAASATAPSANLCTTGTATSVTGSGGQWRWGCNGLHGGASTAANACTAPYASQTLNISANPTSITVGSTSAITAGSTAAGLAVTLTPSGGACTLNGSTATGTAEGTCTITASQPGTGDTGASRYLPASSTPTYITVTPAPVNGACGNSHGGTFTSKPATGLCSAGSAINETGTGPWSWTCQGSHGGTDSPVCTASLQAWDATASASPAQGGTAACTPASVTHGGSATCTATPESGYRFDHWTGHCSGTGACELSNVTGPRSVSAQFSAIPAPAAPQIDPASGGTTGAARPAISGSAEPGSTVEVFSGATSLGTATADAMTGAWSLTPSAPLPTGPHTLTATATNAGGTSPARAPLALDVALFDAPAGGPRVTITSSINGCVLDTPPAFAPADLAGAPMGATAPLGALAFTATQCANGTLTVQIAYPSGSLAGLAPYKWGPASQGATPGWFPHGTVSGDVVAYAVTDDGTGDGDTASGAISDPHAMLLLAAPGAHAIPALGGGAMALLSLLAAALGAVGLRRRF